MKRCRGKGSSLRKRIRRDRIKVRAGKEEDEKHSNKSKGKYMKGMK